MTETAVPQVQVIDFKTRAPWAGVIAPPLQPPVEYYGPWLPHPDEMSVELLHQVMDDTLSANIHSLCVIGVDKTGMPLICMTVPAEFDPAMWGARLLALKSLEEMIMDKLAERGQESFEDQDRDYDEDEDPAS